MISFPICKSSSGSVCSTRSRTKPAALGEPLDYQHLLPYAFGFGVDANDPLKFDLSEPIELIRRLHRAGVTAVNLSCGSPYYNPHIQRPAIFPPSDGYQPPEDPLVGVARQIDAARKCKQASPEMPMVGTGYSYLQDYVPHVAQAAIRAGWIDAVGLGRMVLSYPELPVDTLRHRHPRPQKNLPHVQRLHHGTAQRHYLGVLPA